jgi:ElaB/YqjD/DUF883 family membrane-anchored ribosome-binding protein
MEDVSSTTTSANGINVSGVQPQKVVDRVAQTAHQTVDRVAAAAGPAIERFSSSATSAAETLKAKADQFGALEEQWISSARNYVKDHPLAAVAIAAVAGLVIGRLGGRSE